MTLPNSSYNFSDVLKCNNLKKQRKIWYLLFIYVKKNQHMFIFQWLFVEKCNRKAKRRI